MQRFKALAIASFLAIAIVGSGVVTSVSISPASARATGTATSFAARLDPAARRQFDAWYQAQVFHRAALDSYWADVEQKRRIRRAKRRRRQAFADSDYVTTLPPTYEGPALSKALRRRWNDYRNPARPGGGTPKPSTLPGLDDYMASAKRHFGFAPERIPEIEFKRRFAREALRLGLTRDQILRVYALETGGRGTADMQAGINPITRKGRPISSALGYAQLLAANSVNVLSKHGPKFVSRLKAMVRAEQDPAARQQLAGKLAVLEGMVRAAKSVPYKWSRHIAFAKTGRGRALHVMNMDGVIGPWMQVTKLADLKRMAKRKGRDRLSGEEIELMNLAGPGTGLEMMSAVGIDKPTPNFFSRRAYYRNTVVRGKDSHGLIEALGRRMEAGLKNPGAEEFAAVFDELEGRRPRPRRVSAPPAEPHAFGFVPAPFRPRD